jgi:hypothetical protein
VSILSIALVDFWPVPSYANGYFLCSYKQLHGAKAARAFAADFLLPFTNDFFLAEIVYTNARIIGCIRQRMGLAKSKARRREREGKKIDKQVRLKERKRSRKDIEEQLEGLTQCIFSLSLPLFTRIFFLISCRGKKNTKVLYRTRKRTTTRVTAYREGHVPVLAFRLA